MTELSTALVLSWFMIGAAGYVLGAGTVAAVWGYLYLRDFKKKLSNLKVEIVD